VVLSCPGMPALAKHATVARDDRPHERVRCNRVTPALGEATGKIHHRILQHVFLSPIRTLTVGAGLRLAPNTNLHRLNLQGGSRAPRVGAVREPPLPGLTAGAGISPAPESYAASYTTEGPRQQGNALRFRTLRLTPSVDSTALRASQHASGLCRPSLSACQPGFANAEVLTSGSRRLERADKLTS
jgi:hypothetical protein